MGTNLGSKSASKCNSLSYTATALVEDDHHCFTLDVYNSKAVNIYLWKLSSRASHISIL